MTDEPKQVDITKMTVEELKALAYDLIVQAQVTQQQITLVQQEIAKREAK